MVKLGSIIIQVRGVSYSPKDLRDSLNDESVILLRANNIQDGKINFDDVVYIDKKKVNKNQYLCQGDVLICTSSGSKKLVGKAAYCTENIEVTFGTFCKAIRPSIKCKEFIGHFFNSPYYRGKISSLSSGANINNIRNEHIDNLEINLPDENIQEVVTQKLNLLNKIIVARQAQLSKLDQLVKSRFIEMFGEIIKNDRNWPTFQLSEIADSRLGKMLDSKRQTGTTSFYYLANFNVQWFSIDTSKLNKMDFDIKEQLEFQLRDGDVLVCEGGEIGRCAVWRNQISPCFFQKALHRIRCKKNIILPDYLTWWFKFNSDNKTFESIAGAKATIAHLTGVKLKKLLIATPPIHLQEQFAAFVQHVEKAKS
ncbi:restriction endonuclease subunit S, partial [Desulfovibrio piger]|uniref:restriction endonuclease subunit S n=1 Tax=Desulfovibrio piger TaxID=901 RepID=UPI003A8D0D74